LPFSETESCEKSDEMKPSSPLTQEALDQIFLQARTHNVWLDRPVTDETLHKIFDTMKWGPTSANCSPLRVIFVKTPEAKEKLLTGVHAGNIEKVKTSPVTAILAQDIEFYEKLPKLFPHTDARSWFVGNQPLIEATALKNASLQAAYFIIAARSLGLDCGPLGGFDAHVVDAAFLKGTTWRSVFLCNLGYGDHTKLFPRGPRFEFEEACRIV
jgi:nitroreductase